MIIKTLKVLTYAAIQVIFNDCDNYSIWLVHHADTARIWDDPYSGMVRLQGGNYSGQGLVQYYCKDWKNVCNDASFFKGEAADVVCIQLGYTGHKSYNNEVP